MFVLNFKILSQVVPEKSLTEKSLQTDKQTNILTSLLKKQKLYIPLYTTYTVGIISVPAIASVTLATILETVLNMYSQSEEL